ncbi:MAG: carboxypeptidase-like regulatory domain-containing protein [Cyclobacteriaceae bacterium]|nr:carboxypeptidase-like regulatory domain-containing protein [Cyclobacteriaceae bacterium]
MDDNGGIPGVNVKLKGTRTGAITDVDGKFSIQVKGDNPILVFSAVGYLTEEVQVGNRSIIDVILVEDIMNLEEVVVTGLASSIKRSNLANAVGTVSSKELTGITNQPTMDGALYGKVTGVNINSNSGAPGGGMSMRL